MIRYKPYFLSVPSLVQDSGLGLYVLLVGKGVVTLQKVWQGENTSWGVFEFLGAVKNSEVNKCKNISTFLEVKHILYFKQRMVIFKEIIFRLKNSSTVHIQPYLLAIAMVVIPHLLP